MELFQSVQQHKQQYQGTFIFLIYYRNSQIIVGRPADTTLKHNFPLQGHRKTAVYFPGIQANFL